MEHEERRLELRAERRHPGIATQTDHGKNRREDGVGAKNRLGVDQRRE